MSEKLELPEGLSDMPPGPRLARLLSTLDPSRLNGWQLVEVLTAQNRQVSYEQARLLVLARELAYTHPTGRTPHPYATWARSPTPAARSRSR